MLTLIAYVAATFYDPKTDEKIYEIPSESLRTILTDVPAAVKKDPLFNMLVEDGSLQAVEKKNLKQLENNPMKDITPEGKSASTAKVSKAKAEKTAEAEEEKEAETENK